MEEDIITAYENIASLINSSTGGCVLILGPELAVNKIGIGYKSYFKSIVPKDSTYFDSENLFHFHDNQASFNVRRKVVEYYEQVGDPVLMEMISRIPFPLIINVCPDKAINKTLKRKGIEFSEGYFSKESKTEFNPKIDFPSKNKTVVYNIFGTIDIPQSLILTHNKLYETMEYLLPQNSLPDNIEHFLKSTANSFIFLGFKFDSWYYQLICHKLDINSSPEKPKINISSPEKIGNSSTEIIMGNYFDMKFISENPMQCMHNIIEFCEKDNPQSLRKKSPNSAYSTFVSYARNGQNNPNRENIVDLIEATIKECNTDGLLQLFRDRNDLEFGGSIDAFMTYIGVGKIVIRVISDKYLKSIYCMTEACRMKKYKDEDKRIFTIVMNDADINSDDGIKKYKEYWLLEGKKIWDDETKLNNCNSEDYVCAYKYIDQFIYEIKSQLYLSFDYNDIVKNPATNEISLSENKKAEFEDFMKQICLKMKQP